MVGKSLSLLKGENMEDNLATLVDELISIDESSPVVA